MRNEFIYISGKISGLKPLQAIGKFNKAANELAVHHNFNPTHIINPMSLDDDFPAFERQHFMKLDLDLVEIADYIYMLDNWRDSDGAKKELAHAKALNKKIMYEDPNEVAANDEEEEENQQKRG